MMKLLGVTHHTRGHPLVTVRGQGQEAAVGGGLGDHLGHRQYQPVIPDFLIKAEMS